MDKAEAPERIWLWLPEASSWHVGPRGNDGDVEYIRADLVAAPSPPVVEGGELLPCPFCGVAPETRPDYKSPRVNCKTRSCPLFKVAVQPNHWNIRFSPSPDAQKNIDLAWQMIDRCWDIEPRSYFEAEAPKNGFESPLAMAVHYMWKREAKPPSDAIEAAWEQAALKCDFQREFWMERLKNVRSEHDEHFYNGKIVAAEFLAATLRSQKDKECVDAT